MILRHLGHSGLTIAPLIFGGNIFGWTVDEPTSFQLLDAFVAAGFNCIDTANVYSRWVPGHHGGESETIIGNWMKARHNRNQIVLLTKVGMDMGPGAGGGKGLSQAHIIQSVEHSLARLHTDSIDLYQAHKDDPATPLEETLEAFASLIKAGKVRAIGASNYTGERLVQALNVSRSLGFPRYETLQPLYNLVDRKEFEETLAPVCLENNVGVIPYFSLASGFLTGKYRSEADFDKSARGKGMAKYMNPRGMCILDALDQTAKKHNATQAQIALAWLMAQPEVTAPIASATSLAQLADISKAVDLTLDSASLALLDTASAPG